jgi:peptidyl-prolyl cis-trans isomerase D
MMSKMREMIPTIMWIVLIAFIATIFFAWGMDLDSRGRQEDTYVAKIGKQKITLPEFDRMVNIERERQRENQAGELNPAQYRSITQQVLDQEIQRILLKKVFTEMQVGASADEIYDEIKRNPPPEIFNHPFFKSKDSLFDTTKYIAFLNNPQEVQQLMALEQHAKEYRLPMLKIQSILDAQANPSKSEIAREFRVRNEKVVFQYAKVNASAFRVDSATITEQMTAQYYTANQDSFTRESQAELYYVSFAKKPTSEDEEFIRADLDSTKIRIEKGETTFEEEAKVMSDDPESAKNNGSLGTFKKGTMVPEIEAACLALNPGTISDPIRTSFGYHLIRVEKREEKDGQVEITASHILRKIVPSTGTLDSIERIVDDIRALMEEKGFVAAAKEGALRVDSTGLFGAKSYINGIGYLYGAATFAFKEDQGSISEKLQDDDAYYILGLKQRTDKGVLPLAKVRDEIRQKLFAQTQKERAKEHLEKTIAALDASAGIAGLNQNDTLITSGVTDTITRRSFVAGLGQSTNIIHAAFALPEGKRSLVLDGQDGYVVVRPLWFSKITQIPWESNDVKTIRTELASSERQQIYGDWYLALKKRSNVIERVDQYFLN